MPRRMGVNTRIWMYRFLALRDGEQCARCFDIPTPQNTLYGTLDIDHINAIPFDWDEDNLRLLCHPCNVTIENKRRAGKTERPSDLKERIRTQGQARTRVIRQALDFRSQDAPVTMQANFLYEPDYREWALARVKERPLTTTKADLVNGGAEKVGCSPLSSTRYLAKLTSIEGPLKVVKDMLGEDIVVLRDELVEEPSIKIDLDKGERIDRRQ